MTTLVKSLSAQWAAQLARSEYSAELVAAVAEAAVATNTTYNRNVYSYTAAVIAVGATSYLPMTASYWYTDAVQPTPPGATVDQSVIQGKINDFLATPNERPAMMDIEAWDLGDSDEYDEGIEQLKIAAGMWQDQTDRLVGFYDLFPSHQYARPAALASTTKSTVAWQAAMLSSVMRLDDRIAGELLPYVDFLLPRVYHVYEDAVAQWKWSASWQILEAIRIAQGKPVYPVVWHHWGVNPDYTPLSEANYRASLQFVASFPGIAGVFLWEGNDEPAWYTDVIEELVTGDAEGDFPDPA